MMSWSRGEVELKKQLQLNIQLSSTFSGHFVALDKTPAGSCHFQLYFSYTSSIGRDLADNLVFF